MQLRQIAISAIGEGSTELDVEAEWIYKYAFARQRHVSWGFAMKRGFHQLQLVCIWSYFKGVGEIANGARQHS